MLFKEISKGVGTKCIPASDEEVEEAKKIYKETKKCDHKFIYDREHASSKERIKDYIQIFGHTMLSRPYFEDKIICLDCKKAFILENNEIKEF